MGKCCDELYPLFLRKGNDEDLFVGLSSDDVDFTGWKISSSVDYLYDDGENLFNPTSTVIDASSGSFEGVVNISKEDIKLLKGNEVLTIYLDNGSGKIRTIRYLIDVCL